jgi:hypothetical protein
MVFGNFLMKGLNKIGNIGRDLADSKYGDTLKRMTEKLITPEKILKPIIEGFEGKNK